MQPSDDADRDDGAPVREDVLDAIVGFVRSLRRAGIPVPADAAVLTAEALAAVNTGEKATARAAARATLCTREADISTFERLFEQFWRELRGTDREHQSALDGLTDAANLPAGRVPERATSAVEESADDRADRADDGGTTDPVAFGSVAAADSDELADAPVETATYSPHGRSDPVERAVISDRYELAVPVARMTRALDTLSGRRHTPAASGRFVDARRALRTSLETGGVPASVPETEPATSATRGAVFVDVSQSVLDTIDRGFLLAWLRQLANQWRSLRVFFFDTDVREVTSAFSARTVADVYDALAGAEAAWGGGTCIGDAFSTIRRSHPNAVDHRTTVLVVSDGLERGDVDELERAAAWLARRSRLLLWLNPLATSPAYEPTARGMAAALPAVDGLFAFASVDDVVELARQLERHDRTRLGVEYDSRRTNPDTDPARDDATLEDRPTTVTKFTTRP